MWEWFRGQFTPVGKLIFDYSMIIAAFVTAILAIKNGWLKFEKPIIWARDKTFGRMFGITEIKNNTIKQAGMINERLDKLVGSVEQVLVNQGITQKQQAINSAQVVTLMNMIGSNIFKTDETGHWTFANDNLCKLAGVQEEDILENGWINIVAPSDRERVIAELRHAIADKRTSEIDFSMINRDRKLVHVVLRTEKIQCAKEIHFGFIGSIMIIENGNKN